VAFATDNTVRPAFRFNPCAYELGFFEEVPGQCDACQQHRELKYRGSFYSADEVDYLCPWCIADGSAAREFNGEFSDWIGIDGVPALSDTAATVDLDEAQEVSTRTPSYPTWQQEQWRSHCARPCAFMGFVGAADLQQYMHEPAFAADVNGGIGWDPELLRTHLEREGDLSGYLFQCLTCGAHRLHVDAI
jgi:uncharacterized protein CbrC (UPF0167 family)